VLEGQIFKKRRSAYRVKLCRKTFILIFYLKNALFSKFSYEKEKQEKFSTYGPLLALHARA